MRLNSKSAPAWYWFPLCFPHELLMSFWSIHQGFIGAILLLKQDGADRKLPNSIPVPKGEYLVQYKITTVGLMFN